MLPKPSLPSIWTTAETNLWPLIWSVIIKCAKSRTLCHGLASCSLAVLWEGGEGGGFRERGWAVANMNQEGREGCSKQPQSHAGLDVLLVECPTIFATMDQQGVVTRAHESSDLMTEHVFMSGPGCDDHDWQPKTAQHE